MQAFRSCVNDASLGHIRTHGNFFTWTNKRKQQGCLIMKRLDRMLANAAWFSTFPEGQVLVKERSLMDHNPLLFVSPITMDQSSKTFQFYDKSSRFPRCHPYGLV